MATTESEFGLSEFGYRQNLKRGGVHKFAMFCLSYAFLSLLVGATTLTGFGIATAGPAFWWTWPVVVVGQLLVALLFAELAAEYPIAGSIYTWARRVTSPLFSWLSGWLVLASWTIAIAAVGLTWQLVLTQISPIFQFIGDGSRAHDVALNAFLLGTVMLVVSTAVNMLHVQVASFVNAVAVVVELVVAVLLIVLLFAHAHRGISVVTDTAGTGAGSGGYFAALLVAVAAPGFVVFGFDSAGTLAEESDNPRHEAPRAIIRSVLAAGVMGILLVLAVVVAVDKIDLEQIGAGGLPFIIKQQLGATVGDIFLWAVAAAIFAAAVAVQHAAARLIFAMARDNNLPGGRFLSRLTPRRSPAEAALVVGVIAIALMALNLVQSQVVAALSAVAIIFAYLAYLCVTIPLLRRRLSGRWPIAGAAGRKHFDLGRWGLPINIVAVVWGALLTFDLAWPWTAIYNPVAPFHWYLKYSAYLFIALIAGGGAVWFQTYQRHRTGVVEAHRADLDPAAAASEPQEIGPVSGQDGGVGR